MVAAPIIRISSPVMTVSEAGVFVSELERTEAVTTCSSKMSSPPASCVPDSSAAISRAVARVFAGIVSPSNIPSSPLTATAPGFAGSAFLLDAVRAARAGTAGAGG